MRKYIKNWKELSEIPNESNTHILEVSINGGCGWLKAKEPKDYDPDKDFIEQLLHLDHYLSTHTFYGSRYKNSSKILQACGFDVELANWDKE